MRKKKDPKNKKKGAKVKNLSSGRKKRLHSDKESLVPSEKVPIGDNRPGRREKKVLWERAESGEEKKWRGRTVGKKKKKANARRTAKKLLRCLPTSQSEGSEMNMEEVT